ncbi:hypothetical protein ABFA07_011249 [Porites harrisoni]
MVEITTGFRRGSGYSHPLRNDAKIKLVGEGGETGEERLIPRGGGGRSQLYYMRAKQVGNLAGVKIIRGENDWKLYYLNEVSIRACPFEISRIRQQGSQRCQKTIKKQITCEIIYRI